MVNMQVRRVLGCVLFSAVASFAIAAWYFRTHYYLPAPLVEPLLTLFRVSSQETAADLEFWLVVISCFVPILIVLLLFFRKKKQENL
jgi:hypothetical protein